MKRPQKIASIAGPKVKYRTSLSWIFIYCWKIKQSISKQGFLQYRGGGGVPLKRGPFFQVRRHTQVRSTSLETNVTHFGRGYWIIY